MPAVMREYDYYGYARSRQGVARNATSVSRSNVNQTATHKPTSETTKNAIRNILNDDAIGTNSKKATRVYAQTVKNSSESPYRATTAKKKTKEDLDPVVFPKKQPLQKPQEMKLKKVESLKKAKEKALQKQKTKVKETVKHICMAGILFAMFFLICYRYTSINESFSELNGIKSTLKEKETLNEQVESSIKQNTDLSYIESYAKYQLGMQKPKSSQIKKIVVDKKDKITTPVEIKEEKEKGFLETLMGDFLKIVD